MARSVPLNEVQRLQQAATGVQDELVIAAVPAGAETLKGLRLRGQALTVVGTYTCLIPLSGIFNELEVHVTATIANTVTTAGPDSLYLVQDFNAPSGWTVKVSGTGDGALTSTVRQTATLSGMKGEQYAVYTITLGASATATFTQAEYNGY